MGRRTTVSFSGRRTLLPCSKARTAGPIFLPALPSSLMTSESLDFQLLFEALPTPHLVLTPSLSVAALNKAMCQLLGVRPEAVVGQPVLAVLPVGPNTPTAELWQTTLLEVVQHREPRRLDALRYEQPPAGPSEPGGTRYWQALLQPVLNPAGALRHILIRVLDVTDRVQAEQQVRLSHENFSTLARTSHDVLWNLDLNTGTSWRNEMFTTVFGYPSTPEHQTFEFWHECLHPDDRPQIDAVIAAIKSGGQPATQLSYRLRRADGSWAEVVDRYQLIRDEAGRPARLLGAVQDVTLVRSIERALHHSLEQFQVLADIIPQLVWVLDPQGQILHVCRRWEDYTGLMATDSDWPALVHPEDRARALATWAQARDTGTYYQCDYRLRSHAGQYRWFLAQARPLLDEKGAVAQWFGTCTDIEDQKQTLLLLEEKNAELTRTNQDLDSFVYAVSHDLKQPIHNMAGIFQELIRTAFFRDPDAMKLITMFEKSLHQIDGTIHNLSELVRIQKLRHQQPAERLDMAELTEEVLLSIDEQVTSSRALIRTDFEALPALFFVRPHLQSMLYNLISNALKYAAPLRRPRIRVSTLLVEGQPVLEVQDNGLGLDLQRFGGELFQLFRRFHDHVEGAGLGLYLVNRVVQNAGGHITVDSTVGEGTTFRVFLPPSVRPVS